MCEFIIHPVLKCTPFVSHVTGIHFRNTKSMLVTSIYCNSDAASSTKRQQQNSLIAARGGSRLEPSSRSIFRFNRSAEQQGSSYPGPVQNPLSNKKGKDVQTGRMGNKTCGSWASSVFGTSHRTIRGHLPTFWRKLYFAISLPSGDSQRQTSGPIGVPDM